MQRSIEPDAVLDRPPADGAVAQQARVGANVAEAVAAAKRNIAPVGQTVHRK